ncbi:MAG: O-antigen ligase family protein [Acidimicrobiales bacterium]
MSRKTQVVLVALLVAVTVQAATLGNLAPYVIGGLLVTVNVGAVLWSMRRRHPPAGAGAARLVAPLTVAWLVVSILPSHNFSTRSSADATSSAGLQPTLELVMTMGVGFVALASIRALEPSLDRSRPPIYLLHLPIWVMATSAWSVTAPYATVRGLQMLAICLLAWATVAVGRFDPAALRTIVERFLRWFVWVTLALCVLGVAFGPRYVAIARSNRGRFTWIGAHPTGSGLILGVALVIAVAASGRVLRMPPLVQAGAAVALAAAMYDNHSRAAWIGLGAALVTALALRGFVSWIVRRIGVPVALAGVVAGLYYHGSAVWEYMLRDRDSDSFATGNGRKELWGIGFRALDTAFDWVFGLGYGVTRTLFIPEAPWAGEAHSSVLAFLVSAGLVGVLIFVATLGRTVVDVIRVRMWALGAAGAALASMLVLVVVNGMTSDILAEPHTGFAILYLVAAVALARLQEPVRHAHPYTSDGALTFDDAGTGSGP